MLFDGNNPVVSVVGVLKTYCADGKYTVSPRPYSSLTFRVGGSVTVTTEKGTKTARTNDVLYVPQGVGYTAEYSDNEGLVIHFITEKDDEDTEVFSFEKAEAVYKTFMSALILWRGKEPGFELKTMGQLYTVLGTLAESSTRAVLPDHFLNGIAYINKHYKESGLSVDEVCKKAGMSATVFRQYFKKHYGKTPTEYITELRLEYARNLIARGESIDSSSIAAGFNDPKYFSRVVKKYFGHSPREFKNYGK